MEVNGIEDFVEHSEIPTQKKEESRDEILARHRQEIIELQNKETGMKKTAAKGSKAEQKAKKKHVEEEITLLSSRLKEKQTQELRLLGYITSNEKDKNSIDHLVKAIAGVSVENHPDHSKPSKGNKRREKRAQQEAERDQRIEKEQLNLVSDRKIENEKLREKLEPIGLMVSQIKPDGHCLYRAVEHQLALSKDGNVSYSYLELRKMVADYMRKHSSSLLPFFLSEKSLEDEDSEISVARKFEMYCEDVEKTALWGGQLELGALIHCLKKHIMIYSGSFPDVEMGKEYKSKAHSSIMLSYHKHAFGLGEHYNSVVPNVFR